MRHVFHPEAADDYLKAVEFYEHRRPGLGDALINEVEAAIARIREAPIAWPLISESVRRCRTKRFPYGILYRIRGDRIQIVAVMHLRRRPGYWSRR